MRVTEMANLDENYLQLVRNGIYNRQKTRDNNASSGSKEPTKKKSSNIKNFKHVHTKELKHNTFSNPEKNITKVQAVLYKNTETKSFQEGVVIKNASSIETEKVFPNSNNFNPNKEGKKKQLLVTFPDAICEDNRKRKKEKTIKSKVKQNNTPIFQQKLSEKKHVHTKELKHNAFSNPEKNITKVQTILHKNTETASFQNGAIIKNASSIGTEKIFPDTNNFNPNKEGKKKQLLVTFSDDNRKRKKDKTIKSKLNQNNTPISQQKLSEKKIKPAKRLNKPESKKITKVELQQKEFSNENDLERTISELTLNDSKVSRIKRKHPCKKKPNNSQASPSSIEHAIDFYDDTNITVKGLKFQRFNKLFHSIQMQNPNNALTLQAKYYKTSEEDNFQWDIETSIATPSTDEQQNEKSYENLHINNSFLNYSLENKELSEQSEESQEQTALIINLKDGCKIIVLQHLNQTIYFNGLCYLHVLNGEVNILGASLNTDSDVQKVYSPRGTSLLYIRNECKLDKNTNIALRNLISEDLLGQNDLNLSFKEHCSILLCKPLKEHFIEFIESHISQKIFPEKILAGPRMDFELGGNWNKVQNAEEWDNVLKKVSQISRVVICGGRGVGKSTFLRYSVNVLLSKFKRIRIIELDPGQSEFYPPGCISVVTVDKNILGPNYTHFQAADRLILSHIDIGHNVSQYLRSIKYLLESTDVRESIPTLINFPGFTQGLGLDIAANTLKLLVPTLVIEIRSNNRTRNYIMDMTSDNVNNFLNSRGISKFQRISYNMPLLKYDYEKMDSLSEQKKAWSLEARQAREICLLAYFGKMGLCLESASNMFSINISSLILASFDGRIISPMAINANLVALCSLANKESQIFVAHGYGFVRGIDLDKDILVLLTPEPIESLENVTHLILSSVTTPPSLIFSANGVEGLIPYVGAGDLVDFGQFTKRSYLPPINKIIDK